MTMSMTPAKIEAFERTARRSTLPDFRVGDTVAVHYKIVEGDKLRVQVFHGVVIKQHRAGMRSTLTVRKTSFGVGVERTFPLHSPRFEKIEVEARGVVRKGRLFFLRNLEGKAARLRDEKDR
jgi:large subunit ribosomal protein L19